MPMPRFPVTRLAMARQNALAVAFHWGQTVNRYSLLQNVPGDGAGFGVDEGSTASPTCRARAVRRKMPTMVGKRIGGI